MAQFACRQSGSKRGLSSRNEAGGAATKIAFATYLIDKGLVSAEDVSRLPADVWHAEDSLGRIARYHGLMDDLEVVQVIVQQDNTKALFGETAVQQGRLSTAQLNMLLAGQSVRACVELVETLVFAGCLDQTAGMNAVAQYLSELQAGEARRLSSE